MAWILIAGAAIFALLGATPMLTEWIVRRGRPRKGLPWSENVPRRPSRIEGR
jgi:hypothetical protein